MIEKSVIFPFDLKSFHVVAHSMGCTIALAVSTKYSKSVKSVTLVAHVNVMKQVSPCLIGSLKGDCGHHCCLLHHLSRGMSTWVDVSVLSFAVTSGYGRVCSSYLLKEEVHSMIMILTKHSHHSARYKKKVPDAERCIISNANHMTVILGREKEFTRSLERIWSSSSADTNTMEE
ncbi:hypothetical protein Ddye_025435 [Dipteronia dyeriana]|uniref:AB hydrolase-1 domain-containing protein n=1 Tax=Dipteronia dyeriana TaxID=168575 RepID=A0AAD9TK76_9ROSI|nr:hypothetical protein Ddye_025435 [Dipteronia dyeriana]